MADSWPTPAIHDVRGPFRCAASQLHIACTCGSIVDDVIVWISNACPCRRKPRHSGGERRSGA
jgi:hypothetical protein